VIQNEVFQNSFSRSQVRIFNWIIHWGLKQSSALVTASPTAAPEKFALQISANGNTLFLAKFPADLSKDAIGGAGVKDKAQAAACSIKDTELVCDGKTIGVNPRSGSFGTIDMAPIVPADYAAVGGPPITKGFLLDATHNLHFKNEAEFKKLNKANPKEIDEKQGGESKFGLWSNTVLTKGEPKLFFQLGCPGGDHNNMKGHEMLYTGTAVAIPL
jgi:hypothetical protein